MRRTNWKTVSTLITMVVVAGCQDRAATAPEGVTSGVVSATLAPQERPRLGLNDFGSYFSNSQSDFVVSPSGGVFFVGGNAVVFPANSICDPATSSYGPGTWDQPCTPARSAIKIHAVVRTAKLGTWVDFSPQLRFVPSDNPGKWVWLFMLNPSAGGSSDQSKFVIKYATQLGDLGVDDSQDDSSMRTYSEGGILLSRRIKHFSGYASTSGRSCDPATEADCYPTNDNNGGGVTSPNP